MSRLTSRILQEIRILNDSPLAGVHCWQDSELTTLIHAVLEGPTKSPYALGTFKLNIKFPDRYPFEPPLIQFLTKIYHPNIDNSGRICLDLLKLPPTGTWSPSLNIKALLLAIQQLLLEPNPDDPLIIEIAQEQKSDFVLFVTKAQEHTKLYALPPEEEQSKNLETKEPNITEAFIKNNNPVPVKQLNDNDASEQTTSNLLNESPVDIHSGDHSKSNLSDIAAVDENELPPIQNISTPITPLNLLNTPKPVTSCNSSISQFTKSNSYESKIFETCKQKTPVSGKIRLESLNNQGDPVSSSQGVGVTESEKSAQKKRVVNLKLNKNKKVKI